MAQITRQAKLFAAEDYTVVYDSFINANLQAYDYDTIRTAMVDYVRNNYPENYNDWIESAEFVALLDVVAQFGHNLAFRADLNSRNNFLSTAERQESVFKLAEFLGYQPKRIVPAFGDMKVVSVKTNEAVIGSAGTSLGGQEIRFETTNNVNNLDDFITVMNSVMQSSNSFGSPRKQVLIDNVIHQFYNLNNSADQIKFDVVGTANGNSTTFNVVSLEYNDNTNKIYESSPNRFNSFSLVYKNDGAGINSDNTGFFVGLKQGALQFQDFTIDQTLDSMKLDINVPNINQSDVWVDTITDTGAVVTEWTKVENVYGQNEIYNALPGNERNIFSVKTRENNQISVCFADSNFGNLPKGKIRVWYRTSVNQTYTLRSDDVGVQRITVQYNGQDGNQYNAVFALQIKTPIRTASSSESLDSIKVNAPRNYSAQNRMITASDYNNVMQTLSERVIKTKTINRTHSGHSRYINNMDPTGAYASLDIYGKDGKLYSYDRLISQITAGESSNQVYNKYVKNILDNVELVNLYYTKFDPSFEALKPAGYPVFDGTNWPANIADAYEWESPSTVASGSNNGYFVLDGIIERTGSAVTTYLKYVEVGTLVEFVTPSYEYKWAKVVNISNNGLGVYDNNGDPTGLTELGTGSIVIDADIPDGSYVKAIYPALNRQFTEREKYIIQSYLENNKTFALYYNYTNTSWEVFEPAPSASYQDVQPVQFEENEASWLIWFEYQNNKFDIYTRALRFEFNSFSVEFNNIANEYRIDTYTSKPNKDFVSILDSDFEQEGKFFITGYYTDNNGIGDVKKVIASLTDGNSDTRPDNPRAFTDIVGNNTVLVDIDNNGQSETVSGKENIRFEWQHNPDDNILVDPSFTNVVDVFVLTSIYDTDYRNYLADDVNNAKPVVPTTYELKGMFEGVDDKKAMSDTVVYRPVSYKPLFGSKADSELRARFRVIKLAGANVTDNDIKVKVLEKIGEYFDVNNWDFGETFYFTELAAYVHQELSGLISSFVIVPQGSNSVFGDLFEITPLSSEMFIPDVSIEDIDIIKNITDTNIRAGQ